MLLLKVVDSNQMALVLSYEKKGGRKKKRLKSALILSISRYEKGQKRKISASLHPEARVPFIEPKNLVGLPAQYFDVLEPVLLAMKDFMEKEGRLQPFAYLGCSGSFEITPMQISTE